MSRSKRQPKPNSCSRHGSCDYCTGNRTIQHTKAKLAAEFRCNRCKRPMLGTTAYDGACECGGLIETFPEGK